MKETPWPINKKDRRSTNYSLTTKEQLFCVTGESQGSYSKPQLKNRIEKKRIEQLPQRIQGLIDDIALLEYSDSKFKTDNEWQSLFQEITNVEMRAEKILEKNILYSHQEQNNDVQFGFEIGFMLRSLGVKNRNELIWGLILGQFGLDKEHHNIEEDIVLHTLEEIKNMEENRVKVGESLHKSDKVEKRYSKMSRNRLRKVIENSKINPPIKESGLEKYVFQALTPVGYEYKESDIRSVVKDLIISTDIIEIDRMYNKLCEDQAKISNYIQQGVEVKTLLNYIYKNVVLSERQNMNKKFSREQLPYPGKRNQAVAALNKLSDKDDYSLKTSFPLFSENQSNKWTITNYGDLLLYTMFGRQGATWIYNYEIFPVKISSEERRIITYGLNETGMI